MKEFTAIVRDKNNNITSKTDDYFTNKNDFAEELRSNGFKVIAVLNDKEVETVKNTNSVDLLLNTKYNQEVIEYLQNHK